MAPVQIQQDLGRAKNALQNYLIQKLLIPNVYLDAEWNGRHVDVLAIDRAGSGDVHAAYIVYQGTDVEGALDTVFANSPDHHFPHYLYSAVVNDGKFPISDRVVRKALADDGVGRVGILLVDLLNDPPTVDALLKAERFRSSKEIVQLADKFVATHTPNWQIPDEDRL